MLVGQYASISRRHTTTSCRGRRPHAFNREPVNSARTKGLPYPQVDWSRFHLQILFVDAEDMGGARVAQGMFDQITSWNGYGRALYPWTCGVNVDPKLSPSRIVSMMCQAESLGFSSKVFARTPEQLELDDLYRYDMVVALDEATRQEILSMFVPSLEKDWDDDVDRNYYLQRICMLGDFIKYANKEKLAEIGGAALLPKRMSSLLLDDLDRRMQLTEVPTVPTMQDVSKWNEMVLAIILSSAGLVQYVIDSYPDDLDQFWLR